MCDLLTESAHAAMKNAYAPYSNFSVGAALQTATGKIFSGCNVENASYGLTICAERNAIFQAVAAGERKITELVIVCDGDTMPYPCGACRQVMSEFFTADSVVTVVDRSGKQEQFSMAELLPKSFTLEKEK